MSVSHYPLDARQAASLRELLSLELEEHPEWPDVWNFDGLLHALEGRLDEARTSFRNAIARNPHFDTARWSLRWIDVLSGHGISEDDLATQTAQLSRALQPVCVLQAVQNLRRGVRPDPLWEPGNPAAAFAAICVAAHLQDEDALEAAWQRLRELDPQIEESFRMADLGGPDGFHRRRLADLGRSERLNPGFADLLLKAGRMEAMAGQENDARRLFALESLLRGNHASLLVELGDLANRAGREEEALSYFERAVEENPTWHGGLMALGYELSVRGHSKEALEKFEKAVEREPDYPDLRYQYGLLLHAASRTEEAIEAMRKSIEGNPGYHVARIALANFLFETNRETESVPHYERVFDEGIDPAWLAGRFGYAMHSAGHPNRAEELFLEAVSEGEDRPEVLFLYGSFLADTDREREAQAVWERALGADPPDPLRQRIESVLTGSRGAE